MAQAPVQLLVVEDEPITRSKLAAHFEKEGYEVVCREDGSDRELNRLLRQKEANALQLQQHNNALQLHNAQLLQQMQEDAATHQMQIKLLHQVQLFK